MADSFLAVQRTERWNGRRVTLMGLGHHGGGLAAARYLAERGARLTISDQAPADSLARSLDALRGWPIAAVKCGGHDPADFLDAQSIVVNPAVPIDHELLALARAARLEITSEIEIFLRACPAHVVGVTGTNGKSSTATMLAEMLTAAGRRTHLGGNIGRSLLAELPRIARDDWVVLELSSFQLAHLAAGAPSAEIGIVTNCTPHHLDWHGDARSYAAAKRRLVSAPGTLAVLDPGDPMSGAWAAECGGRTVAPWPSGAVGRLRVAGPHQRKNAALAAAAAEAAGVAADVIRDALEGFRGLPHRIEWVGEIAGRRFYNDSKATSPAASLAALDAVPGRLWLLAGGADRGADLEAWAAAVVARTEGAAVFGAARGRMRGALLNARRDFAVQARETLNEALDGCWRTSRCGDAIVLSPACASHDQFADFEARGRAFCQRVAALAARDDARALRLAPCTARRAALP